VQARNYDRHGWCGGSLYSAWVLAEQWPSVFKLKLVHSTLFGSTCAAHYIKNHQSFLFFCRSETIERFEEENHIALYQKPIVIALWAKSKKNYLRVLVFFEMHLSFFSSAGKTFLFSLMNNKNITYPGMVTYCVANQKSRVH
jgi:hypothetical protein